MKRFLSLALVSLLFVLPMGVKADTKILPSCSTTDSEGVKTCIISGKFDSPQESIQVTLTEEGGADITSIANAENSEYLVGTTTESGSSHTFTVTHDSTTLGPAGNGEYSLFSFSYKVSGEDNCKVVINVDDIKAETPTPTSTSNKQTGSSVPYIALGTMVVLAGGAYLLTKNKTKMFKMRKMRLVQNPHERCFFRRYPEQ